MSPGDGRPVGVYVRVSRKGDREDERFHSPREQAERAGALALDRGYSVGPTFEDIDVSGATPPGDRPGMGALLEAVERGELAGVAAFSLDRLSREPAHGDELVRRVTRAGGVILTPDIPDEIDSPAGEFTFGMLLQVAKLYRSQARARFSSAIERAILAGIPVGPVPIGYRQREDRRLEVDPETAPVVRELFERRAAGVGWVPLGRFLREATGQPWSRNTPRKIIGNRIYATGRLDYGGILAEVECGSIVDEPLWHAAQRAYAGPRPKREPGSRWLLTGLARCDSCGRSLGPWKGSAHRRTRKGERVPVKTVPRRYKCVHGCPTSVDAPRLERFVTLRSFEAGDELETRERAPDLGALEEAANIAERRLEQVMAPDARDALGDLWASDVKARRTERDGALAALGAARRAAGVDAARTLRLREEWEKLSSSDRRDALALFWREVRVAPKDEDGAVRVTLVARGPGGETELQLDTQPEGSAS